MDRLLRDGFTVTENKVMKVVGYKAKLVYWCLCMRAKNENGTSFPSQKRIAADCGIGLTSTKEGLSELIKIGAVKSQVQEGKGSLLYTVTGKVSSSGEEAIVGGRRGGSRQATTITIPKNYKQELRTKFFEEWQKYAKGYKCIGFEIGLVPKIVEEVDDLEQVVKIYHTDDKYRKRTKTIKDFYFTLGEIVNSGNKMKTEKDKPCPKCGSSSFFGSANANTVRCISCDTTYSRVA